MAKAMPSPSARLPFEVLEQVVECLLPVKLPVVFRSHDIITKTLVSLTLTSTYLSSIAYRLLYTFCLDIDSPRKLQLLVKSFESQRVRNALSRPSSYPMGMYLAPYADGDLDTPEIDKQIYDMCAVLSNRLERLIIDIPIPKLYHLDEDPRRPDGQRYGMIDLNVLTAVTDFCSLTDEFGILTCDVCDDLAFWGEWKNLQRLALFNAGFDRWFEQTLKNSESLTHFILMRTNTMTNEMFARDMSCFPSNLRSLKFYDFTNDLSTPWNDPLGPISLTHSGGCVMEVKEMNFDTTEDEISWMSALKDAIRQHACAGTLWDLKRIP